MSSPESPVPAPDLTVPETPTSGQQISIMSAAERMEDGTSKLDTNTEKESKIDAEDTGDARAAKLADNSTAESSKSSDAASKSEPDKSKTQISYVHYLKRFRVWNANNYKYDPFDPSAYNVSSQVAEDDNYNYFYVEFRYQTPQGKIALSLRPTSLNRADRSTKPGGH